MPPSSKLPVMVFFHGGAFNAGSGNQMAPPFTAFPYNGCDLAAKGVIVVTLNYRLAKLGFLAYLGADRKINGNFGVCPCSHS